MPYSQPTQTPAGGQWLGVNRGAAPFAISANETPDAQDVGLYRDQEGLLGVRRGRARAALYDNNLNGLGFLNVPWGEFTVVCTDNGDVTVYQHGGGFRLRPTSGWDEYDIDLPAVCYGPGTTNGVAGTFAPGFNLRRFGLLLFDRDRIPLYGIPLYEDEDMWRFVITGVVTEAIAILQLEIGGVWTNWITSTFNAATGWTTIKAGFEGDGDVTRARCVSSVVVGTGDLDARWVGTIIGVYGGRNTVQVVT